MNKTEARKTLLNAAASDADKEEARRVLKLNADGSEDGNITGADTGADTGDANTESQMNVQGSGTSQVGGFNNANASNQSAEQTNETAGLDSFPNTGESTNLNRPSVLDTGAAGAAAATANSQRFRHDRPSMGPTQQVLRRQALTGEVDSATTQTEAAQTAAPNAAAATQRMMDNRGYSNFREVPNPTPVPTLNVPVSNMVHYVDEGGVPLGSVERGQEAKTDEVIVIGGKEFVVVSEALGSNQNSIAVRQNLPMPIN